MLPIALGTVAPDSPVAKRTFKSLEKLWNQAWKTGGYGRYHVTSEPDSPGGWPFASLFIARAAVEAGDDAKVWRILRWLDAVPGATAGTWFEFYGRRLAPPFPQVGIVVWNWAEMLVLQVHHLLGVQPREDGLRIRPRLLPGVKSATATFLLRGQRLTLRVTRGAGRERATIQTNGQVIAEAPGEITIAYGFKDPLTVTARI